MVLGMKDQDYCWYEMTFFVHQPDNEFVTVIMFDVPDDEVKIKVTPILQGNGISPPLKRAQTVVEERQRRKEIKEMNRAWKPKLDPCNFLDELRKEMELACSNSMMDLDWRCIQALLLQGAVGIVDRAVWACSKAVRQLEKVCRPPNCHRLTKCYTNLNPRHDPTPKTSLWAVPSTSQTHTTSSATPSNSQKLFQSPQTTSTPGSPTTNDPKLSYKNTNSLP